MADRVLVTDWKCIGRSGPTVDGRVIDKQFIVDMAANYDKTLFTALIWPEHQRWFNMGSVEQLKAVDNSEGGKDLFAIVSPNEYYLNANAAGQKMFTSMEITVDFRKTGKAYLTGLGATDDPASAATTEIRLSQKAQLGGVIISNAVEMFSKQFEETVKQSLAERLLEFFTSNPNFLNNPHQGDNDMADKAAIEKLSAELAELKTLFAAANPDIPKTAQDDPYQVLLSKVEALEKQIADKAAEKPEVKPDEFKALAEKLELFAKKLDDALKEQPGTTHGEYSAAGENENKDIF